MRCKSAFIPQIPDEELLTIAAKSPCPPMPPPKAGLAAGGRAAALGRAAVGTGGLPPTGGLGAPGFEPTGGGGAGLGFVPTGGGGFAPVAGVPFELEAASFFHGVAEPFEGAIPGKTETGFADALAATGFGGAALTPAGFAASGGFAAPPGVGLAGGGGGGGAATAFGLRGTSSR